MQQDQRTVIIYLSNRLQVFYQDSQESGLKLLIELESQGRGLDLQSRFEQTWLHLYKSQEFTDLKQIYLLLSPLSGFTDSRIVFIWLKSWRYFQPQVRTYFVQKVGQINLPDLHINLLKALLAKSSQNPPDLSYVQEPRIGKK